MQIVNLTFKTPTAVIENGKPVVKYEVANEQFVVASTKSFNNLIDDLKQEGKIATHTEKKDLFLDKEKTEKAIDSLVAEQIKDDAICELVQEFVKKALDGACVYYKPIIRKK